MRIRNRALSFSALSCSSKSDLSTIPETKNQHEQAGKVHQHEEEEDKVHLNSDSKPQHQSYYSDYSLPPANESRSPSKEEDQLRQVEDRVYEHGCKNYIDGSSCLIPDQEDCATKEEGEKEETWSANHKRSKNSGAQISGLHLSSQAGASWGEGENAFPLKKRKRKYEFMIVSPMEKKKQEDLSISNRVINVKKVKNNNSKSSLLEGSRCSRVNGRGWRCCQATLVGYSLCEHHLGKGRLKSINNTLRNSSASKSCSKKRKALSKKKNEKQFLLGKKIQDEEEEEDEDEDEDDEDDDDDDDDDDDGGEGKEEKKKKKKAGGVVKARSMSSLLGQMSHG